MIWQFFRLELAVSPTIAEDNPLHITAARNGLTRSFPQRFQDLAEEIEFACNTFLNNHKGTLAFIIAI